MLCVCGLRSCGRAYLNGVRSSCPHTPPIFRYTYVHLFATLIDELWCGRQVKRNIVKSSTPPLAQLVEQSPFKREVPGSSPGGRTRSTTNTMVATNFKSTCRQLRANGATLAEICEATGRSKTTVWFHIQDIPLAPERKEQVVAAHRARLAEYVRVHRYGKSRLGKHPSRFSVWDEDTVCGVAHLLFDGRITREGCSYYNRSMQLTWRVQECLQRVYPYPPTVYFERTGVIRTCYHNVEFGTYMLEKAAQLKMQIAHSHVELQRIFLRAFFDDEGCISYRTGTGSRCVRGYQHDHEMLLLIQSLLINFGIESTLDKRHVELTIRRKRNITRFRDEIGFSPGVYVNGARTNSVWGQSLEKRVILDRAIASYLPAGTPGVTHANLS